METAAAAFVILVVVLGIVVLFIASVIFKGYVLSILWGWFAVPIFHLPPLGIAQAIAVSLVVSMLTHQYIPTKDKDTWAPILTMVLWPALALFVGWIVKGYI